MEIIKVSISHLIDEPYFTDDVIEFVTTLNKVPLQIYKISTFDWKPSVISDLGSLLSMPYEVIRGDVIVDHVIERGIHFENVISFLNNPQAKSENFEFLIRNIIEQFYINLSIDPEDLTLLLTYKNIQSFLNDHTINHLKEPSFILCQNAFKKSNDLTYLVFASMAKPELKECFSFTALPQYKSFLKQYIDLLEEEFEKKG